MSFQKDSPTAFHEAINRGFSRQSNDYDHSDQSNQVLQDMRHQVYAHVEKYLRPESYILELNAGTGLDALHFISAGHRVHATDLSDGMIRQIRSKISENDLSAQLTFQQVSFDQLDKVYLKNFDYVFSNFGGLNCIQDLSLVSQHLPPLLKPNAFLTWVIMPPVCPWELLAIFKGRWKHALRRLNKNGTLAHLEGEYFKTYYHSLKNIRSALGPSFTLIGLEGLAALSPQPYHKEFPVKHPEFYNALRKLDGWCHSTFPFNRWADHIMVTFQYKP